MLKLILALLALTSFGYSQECQMNQALFIDSCISECPQYTITQVSNGFATCVQCDVTKLLIPNSDRTQCVCTAQTYFDRNRQECLPCHYSCLTCNGPSQSNCSSCDSNPPVTNRVRNQGNCVCQAGYFQNLQVQSTICVKCDDDCESCNGPQDTDCITCAKDRVKNQFGLCACKNDFVPDANGNCNCPAPLSISPTGSCVDPVTQCSSGLRPALSGNIAKNAKNKKNKNQCVCPAGLNLIKGLCRTCGPNQQYNQKKGRCQCPKSAIKYKKQCIVCPANQSINRRTGQCDCKRNEQKTQTGECIRCPNKSIYFNGSCQCIFNFYPHSSGRCRRCTRKTENPACIEDAHGVDRPGKLTSQQVRRRRK